MARQSYIWLDYVRAISIYLVVLGHTALPELLNSWVYAFHMPFFFAASGFLFNPDKFNSWTALIKQKAKSLLLPYLLFNLLTYPILLGKLYVQHEPISISNDIVQLFVWGEPPYDGPLWFLLALFFVEIIAYAVVRYKKANLLGLLALFAAAYATTVLDRIPYYFDVAVVAVPFFLATYLLRNKIARIDTLKTPVLIGLFCLTLCASVAVGYYNGAVAMVFNSFGSSFWLFWIGAVVGIASLFFLGQLLAVLFNRHTLIETISRNTMVVLALHIPLMSVAKMVLIALHATNLLNSTAANILFALGVLLALVPLIKPIKRYVPFLIGK